MNPRYKIAFFGTPLFTTKFLDLLKSHDFTPTLVATGVDQRKGRGMELHAPEPKLWAIENDIKYIQPEKLDVQTIEEIKKEEWDLFIVIAYGKIIPETLINTPKHGTINLHYSLLPKYRGATPVETTVLNRDVESGITIQKMVYQLDAGNILYQEKINVYEDETSEELRTRMNELALKNIINVIKNIFSGNIQEIKQDETQATSTKKISKEDMDVTNDIKNKDMHAIYRKFLAYDKKIFFFHNVNEEKIRVKITNMNSNEILTLLPESKKEINVDIFLQNYGTIFK